MILQAVADEQAPRGVGHLEQPVQGVVAGVQGDVHGVCLGQSWGVVAGLWSEMRWGG
jgi:hypothetical protein